jgi:tetratricopeptide (TPR) repeat protein
MNKAICPRQAALVCVISMLLCLMLQTTANCTPAAQVAIGKKTQVAVTSVDSKQKPTRTEGSPKETLSAVEAGEVQRISGMKQEDLTSQDERFALGLVEKHPSSSAAHGLLSNVMQKKGFASLSCEESQQAWRLNRQPDLLYASVKMLINNKFDDDLVDLVKEGCKFYANDYKTLLSLALLLQMEKQDAVALNAIAQAERIRPGAPEISLTRVHSLLALEKFSEAVAPAKSLARNSSTRPAGLLALARIARHEGQKKASLELATEAYKLAKADADVCLYLFNWSNEDGFFLQALEPGLLAMAKYTGHLEAKQIKVAFNSKIKKHNLRQLATAATNTAALLPDPKELSYLLFSVGDICDHAGGVNHAIAYYKLGLQVNPGYGRAYMRLARDLEKVGEPAQAVTQLYARAAQLAPRDLEVKHALLRNEERAKTRSKDIAFRIKNLLR